MKLQFGKLLPGVLMLLIALTPAFSTDAGEKFRFVLVLIGCALGACGNALLRRSQSGGLSWKHIANGGWLGATILPAATVALLGSAPDSLGQYLGFSLGWGLLMGYGLGLTVAGAGFLATSASTTQPRS
jgi:hypothetical protein